MKNTILLVVDVQTALINYNPYNKAEFIANIRRLLETARQSEIEVVYVRHNDKNGSELEHGTDGWQIFNLVSPQSDDMVFDKNYNSAFKETGLKSYLDGKGISDLILVGMQTEYCIDATCKVAFEYGYSITIPSGTTSTFDSSYSKAGALIKFYEEKIWNGRFAKVLPVEDVILKMNAAD